MYQQTTWYIQVFYLYLTLHRISCFSLSMEKMVLWQNLTLKTVHSWLLLAHLEVHPNLSIWQEWVPLSSDQTWPLLKTLTQQQQWLTLCLWTCLAMAFHLLPTPQHSQQNPKTTEYNWLMPSTHSPNNPSWVNQALLPWPVRESSSAHSLDLKISTQYQASFTCQPGQNFTLWPDIMV